MAGMELLGWITGVDKKEQNEGFWRTLEAE